LSDDSKSGFGSYKIGTSYPIREGMTPVTGLQQAIFWGAPVVELSGLAGQVGKTGRRVIKQLAEANEVELTWHAPPMQQLEFAYPDEKVNEEAGTHFSEGIKMCKEVGAKLINIHATNIIPRPGKDAVLVYDNVDKRLIDVKFSKKDEEEAKKKGVNVVDYVIERASETKKAELWERMAQMRYFGESYKEEAERLKPFVKSFPEAKRAWNVLSKRAKKIVANYLNRNRITYIDPRKGPSEKDIEKIKKWYEIRKDNAEAHLKLYEELKTKYDHYIRGKEPVIVNGVEKMKENFVKKFAPQAEKAVKEGIKIGIENSDNRYVLTTPEEMNEVVTNLKEELVKRGLPKEKVDKYVGVTFDMGHAASMQGITVRNKKGELVRLGPPDKYLEQLKVPVIHVHAHENFGDLDAHLPMGEAFTDEQREKIMKFLKEKGFKGKVIHEPGAIGGLSYAISMLKTAPSLYQVYGVPTTGLGGPSYMMTDPTEGLFFPAEKREHYFYGSWITDIT